MFYYVRDSGEVRPHFDARRSRAQAGLWIIRSPVRLVGFVQIDLYVVREYCKVGY